MYYDLCHLFDQYGVEYLYVDKDIEKFKGCFYLSALAGEIWYKLRDPIHDLMHEDYLTFRIKHAILSDCKDLALEIAGEYSAYGAVIMGDYEKAKQYLPKDSKEIPKYDEIEQMLWAIVYNDEKKMNHFVEKRIKSQRKDMKRSGYACYYMDDYALAMIKLAKERGMQCNLEVRELPLYLLDDNTQVDREKWKLPEDKEVEELLGYKIR